LGFVLEEADIVRDPLHQPPGPSAGATVSLNDVYQFVDHHAVVFGVLFDVGPGNGDGVSTGICDKATFFLDHELDVRGRSEPIAREHFRDLGLPQDNQVLGLVGPGFEVRHFENIDRDLEGARFGSPFLGIGRR